MKKAGKASSKSSSTTAGAKRSAKPKAKREPKREVKRKVKRKAPEPVAGPKLLRPLKIMGGKIPPKRSEDRGPLGWLLPQMETAYTRLSSRDAITPAAA